MAGGPGYASKPRPAVIIQDDGFSETLSIAVCPLTSEPIDAGVSGPGPLTALWSWLSSPRAAGGSPERQPARRWPLPCRRPPGPATNSRG